MLNRRKLLKGVTAGTATYLFAPLLKAFADQAAGTYQVPKRVLFVLFDNGFYESACQPAGVPLGGDRVRQVALAGRALPHDIEPFTPFLERLTVVQGLRGSHLAPNHGAGFGALSGLSGGVGEDKFRRVVGESIDAAVARTVPSVFPILVLGVAAGKGGGPTTALSSSAWGAGRPIAAQCRPELAYESLFGPIGADRNDFAVRRNLLDFVAEGPAVFAHSWPAPSANSWTTTWRRSSRSASATGSSRKCRTPVRCAATPPGFPPRRPSA